MYGEDYAYAATRLQGTIVRARANNEPVLINQIDGNGNCSCTLLFDDSNGIIHLDELNLKPVSLGYVNTGRGVTFLSRIPKRRDWKQGLRSANCYSSNGGSLDGLQHKNLRDCIVGNYPSFKKAKADSLRSGKIVAFHRHWAINEGYYIFYKGEFVAKLDGPLLVFNNMYNHLKEYFEEVTHESRT